MPVVKMLHSGETNIDSTDIWRFTFHSAFPTYKIGFSGSSTFKIPSGDFSGAHTVTHNLGYNPFYVANVLYGTRGYQVSSAITPLYNDDYIYAPNTSGWDSIINFYTSVDGNTLEIGASTGDGELLVSDFTLTANWIILLDEF